MTHGRTREAPTPSPKIISVSGAKNEPITSPMYLLCLDHYNLSFSVMLMKGFQSLQSRRFEARRGLAEATPRTQNVLAQGQSEAHGDSKLYNTIVEDSLKTQQG